MKSNIIMSCICNPDVKQLITAVLFFRIRIQNNFLVFTIQVIYFMFQDNIQKLKFLPKQNYFMFYGSHQLINIEINQSPEDILPINLKKIKKNQENSKIYRDKV